MQVIGIGDNVCDLYLDRGMMYPGGQALNFAVNTRDLGLVSHYMGVFGTDEAAQQIKSVLVRRGIPFPKAQTVPGENGRSWVELRDGDRVFLGSNKGGVLREHPIRLDREDLGYLDHFLVAHTTNNSYFDGELPSLKAHVSLVSYDYSTCWREADRVARTAPYVDMAFLSCGEESVERAEETARHLNAAGIAAVCVTLGSRGAAVWTGGDFLMQHAFPVQVVDTMGAGDAFASRILAGVAETLDQEGTACWRDEAWRYRVMREQLPSAAEFAAQACRREGSFGEGVPIPPGLRPGARPTGESV